MEVDGIILERCMDCGRLVEDLCPECGLCYDCCECDDNNWDYLEEVEE